MPISLDAETIAVLGPFIPGILAGIAKVIWAVRRSRCPAHGGRTRSKALRWPLAKRYQILIGGQVADRVEFLVD